MPVMESTWWQSITFLLKCMNQEFLQVVLYPPTEGHAAAHVLVLHNVVLHKDCSCLKAVRQRKQKKSLNVQK